jgi:hypothetical protein
VTARLQEAAIVEAPLADEDGLHRRLHVVVDAAPAGPLEQCKCPVVGVKHHLLRLARIGPHEQHPAVAKPNVSHLHDHRDPAQRDHFVAPVTGRFLRAQSSAAHRLKPSRLHAFGSSAAHTDERHHSGRHSQGCEALQTTGSASAVSVPPCSRSPPATGRALHSRAQSSGAADLSLVPELRCHRTDDLEPPSAIRQVLGRSPGMRTLTRSRSRRGRQQPSINHFLINGSTRASGDSVRAAARNWCAHNVRCAREKK